MTNLWRTSKTNQRIRFEEGLELLVHAPLHELQEKAMKIRYKKNPTQHVTFVLDSNPNYTNICNVDCSFCAFFRHEEASDAYTKTVDEVLEHLALARRAGLSTVLLQGGLNKNLDLSYYVNLVEQARKEYPDIHPHFFSAPEIWHCAEVSHVTVREVLQALYDAGQRTLPGGGAEILSERVHAKVSPKKITPNMWIEIHKVAHQIGFRSTATMMYGHVEEPEDVLIHLEALRLAQDESGGFTAFIPWSYKPERTALGRHVKTWAGKTAYLRIIAFSRLYLDNFDHIQATWFSEGKETGIESLHYGADDFGGIILEENVHRAANFINKTNHRSIISMIRQAGFKPLQRDPLYNIVRSYDHDEEVDIPEAQCIKENDSIAILSRDAS